MPAVDYRSNRNGILNPVILTIPSNSVAWADARGDIAREVASKAFTATRPISSFAF